MKLTTLYAALGLSGAYASDCLSISTVYGDNMVLNRAGTLLAGTAAIGDSVSVALDGQVLGSTDVNQWGIWEFGIGAQDPSSSHQLTVTSEQCADSLSLNNVAFGDVFFCGGQSNMQFTANMMLNATAEMALADNYPDLRFFTTGDWDQSTMPLFEPLDVLQPWAVSSQDSVGATADQWTYMSAVCYEFGRKVHQQIGVPVGLVSSNWGGTMIETWMSPDALAKCGEQDMEAAAESGFNDFPTTPSGLYNSMVVPFLPMQMTGAIWYQGEANVGAAQLYSCEFPAMISDWRAKWGNDFPFGFVQLAPYKSNGDQSLADMRVAQTAALDLDGVVMATAIDLVDPDSPEGDIHPRDKVTVGHRLSAGFLDVLYGQTQQYTGPTFESAKGNGADVDVTYVASSCGSGLTQREASCPSGYEGLCAGWEVLSIDGTWHAADATLGDCSVSVSSKEVATAAGVRYAMSDVPLATVYNMEGFPATPFETAF